MRGTENAMRTLLVTPGKASADALRAMLDPRLCPVIDVAGSANEARQKLLGTGYDLVLINAPLADESGCRLASDISKTTAAGVLLLVRGELAAQVAEATGGDGVITLGKPVSRAQIAEAVSVFASVLAKLRRYEAEKRDLERRLDELRITARAKCLLMDQMHLSEEDAHRYLEKQAMDHRMTKLEFAKSVIRLFSEG